MYDINKIINVKFTRRGKGYDIAEVDEFLDEIVEELKVEQKRIADREAELDEAQKGIVKALLTAQTAAQNIENEAKEKAEAIIGESKLEASKIEEANATAYKELIEKVHAMKEFCDSYRDAVIKDMENQLDAFKAGFLSEAIYEVFEDEYTEKESAEPQSIVESNDNDVEKVADDNNDKPELDTGSMASIDLGEIISGLPQSDSELKALIDEIM